MNDEMKLMIEREAQKLAFKRQYLMATGRADFAATGRDLHTDIPLSNVALGYRPDDSNIDKLMPVIDVPNQSGFVTEFFRKDALRIERTRRAPGTEANKVDRNVGSVSFFCENYALKTGVTTEDLANADPTKRAVLFNGAAEFVTGKLWLDWEVRAATLINTSNVGSYSVVASRWDSAGDPIKAVKTAREAARLLSGKIPNRAVFGYSAWESFRQNSNVRNLIFGTNNGGGFASIENAKDLLEIDELVILKGIYNSANEAQAESLVATLGDAVMLYYAPSRPSINEPSWGYSYRWAVPGIPSMVAERHPFDNKTKKYEVEVGYFQDEAVTGSALAYLIQSVNSNGGGSFGV